MTAADKQALQVKLDECKAANRWLADDLLEAEARVVAVEGERDALQRALDMEKEWGRGQADLLTACAEDAAAAEGELATQRLNVTEARARATNAGQERDQLRRDLKRVEGERDEWERIAAERGTRMDEIQARAEAAEGERDAARATLEKIAEQEYVEIALGWQERALAAEGRLEALDSEVRTALDVLNGDTIFHGHAARIEAATKVLNDALAARAVLVGGTDV